MKLEIVGSGKNAEQGRPPASMEIAGDVNKHESAEMRVQRLYNAQGGPLIGWLLDEARRRNDDKKTMAQKLNCTYGYIHQLQNNLRSPSHISQDFAEGCARYLGVPTIIVKVICGSVRMSDFAVSCESEDQMFDRALRLMQDDPHVRKILPCDLSRLSLDARKAVLMLYSEYSARDVFSLRELPNIVRWLQRAGEIHDENEFAAIEGHRGMS